ncbi:MAG TPA: hypothetical protein VK399_06435 [Longimicrobiaceae bacterium]|nr:hypothetical protein [Longimicrobiaceae bacterium]
MPGWTLPEPTLSRTLLRRSLGFWPGVRLIVLVVPLMFATAAGRMPPILPLLMEPFPLAVVPVTALLAVLETRRRHEHLMFANLGTGPVGIAGLAAVPPLLGETALVLLAAR